MANRPALKGNTDRNCVQWCNITAMSCSASHPGETWDVTAAITDIKDIPYDELHFKRNESVGGGGSHHRQPWTRRYGWVPELLPLQTLHVNSWRQYASKHKKPVMLPCSSSTGEDAAVLRTFFTDVDAGTPLRGGRFLEIGGEDGFGGSNSWVFEACLDWQGTLVEAHPDFFARLRRNRPATLNLRLAACRESGWLNYSNHAW